MKKLTWALLSMMVLFFSMGTAWAQDDMGGGEMPALPETVTPPTFSPDLAMTTLQPGDAINFVVDEEMVATMTAIIYVIDGTNEDLNCTSELFMAAYGDPTSVPFVLNMDEGLGFEPYLVLKSGNIKARLVLAEMDETSGGMTLALSSIVSADFTVEGEADQIPLPTFGPVSGTEVEPQTEVVITSGYEDDMSDDFQYRVVYVIDGTDADLTGNSFEAIMSNGKAQQYAEPIKIFKAQTIKARTVKLKVNYESMATTIVGMSDVATASYTVKGGDVEDLTVPKLTLNKSVLFVTAGGTAVFSCTLETREYETTEGNDKRKLGFVFDPDKTTKGDITKVEYQIGETISESAWQEWPAEDWKNFGNSNIAAMPGSMYVEIAKNQTYKIYYRVTVADKETVSGSLGFKVALAPYGALGAAADPLAEAQINIKPRPAAPTLEFTPRPATTLTVLSGESTELWVRPKDNKEESLKMYYRVLTADGADQTADISESDAELTYSTSGGGDWNPIKVTENMVKNGKFTVKVAACLDGQFYPAVKQTFDVEILKEEYASTLVIDPQPESFMVGEVYTVSVSLTADAGTLDKNKNSEVNLTVAPVTAGILFEKVEYRIGTEGDFTALDADIINDLMDIPLGKLGAFVEADKPVEVKMTMARKRVGPSMLLKFGITTGNSFLDSKTLALKAFKASCLDRPAVDPTFTPAPGYIVKGGTVTLQCETEGAEIHYTTDGKEPTEASAKYEGTPIPINALTTIKAAAFKDGGRSFVVEGIYSIVGIPQGMPASGRVVVDSLVTITLSHQTENTKIYYTTDGTEPTAASTEYTAPFKLKAKVLKVVAISGNDQSPVITREYELAPAKPVFSVKAGAVPFDTEVSISCATEGAKIYWLFGSTEELSEQTGTLYDNQPIKLKQRGVLKAIAYYEGIAGKQESALYKVGVSTPKFSLPSGEVPVGARVVITSESKEANTNPDKKFHIVYTLDNSEPTAGTKGHGTEYTAPIEITENVTIKAITWVMDVNGLEKSAVATATYTVEGGTTEPEKDTVATPTFNPAASEVEKGTKVTIACETEGAKIYYTIDGSEPTAASTEGFEVVINEALTIKAIALKGETKSAVAEAAYTIKGGTTEPEKDTVATPTFNPAAGEVAKGTKVEIACATDSVKIYYTVDGSEPTAASTEYTAAIEINEALTIKAIAIKGETKSAVATAAYTVKVANEGLELSGVSVYPNPSDGEFQLDLPVAATVEVFASTGVLRQRVEAGAGVMTLNIDRSGIYFLRITADGRTTVKRVVVR